eukprot:m.240102 g.240102  ORF g.240102 m.240102 type:complete len:50 (-) comp15820_c0_seq1:53-202(-)
MRGFADGCRSVNSSTKVTFDRLVTLNYGFDWVSANVFSGNLLRRRILLP